MNWPTKIAMVIVLSLAIGTGVLLFVRSHVRHEQPQMLRTAPSSEDRLANEAVTSGRDLEERKREQFEQTSKFYDFGPPLPVGRGRWFGN